MENRKDESNTILDMDLREFIIQFQDYLAPKLDTYEQAIYLYIFRHSRLLGMEDATIPFKSERHRMACGIGEKGAPMSETTASEKLKSLESKGFLKILRTEHKGRLLHLYLPSEIPNLIPLPTSEAEPDLETMDFFNVAENRLLLLKREEYKCFYTLQELNENNFVVEHVVSRPAGDNSYRNCVAASREANNKKGSATAEDYFRKLYRDHYLSEVEFSDRMRHLELLKSGELKPTIT